MSDKIGYGIIRLSFELANEVMPSVSLDATTMQGELRDLGFFAHLQKRLLLPASYEIHAAYIEPYRLCWCIVVTSPEIPYGKEGEYLPHVEPIYGRDKDNNTYLIRIHIQQEYSYERVLRVD